MISKTQILHDISLASKRKKPLYKECLRAIELEFVTESSVRLLIVDQLSKIKIYVKRRRVYKLSQPKPTPQQIKELYREELKLYRRFLKWNKYLLNE